MLRPTVTLLSLTFFLIGSLDRHPGIGSLSIASPTPGSSVLRPATLLQAQGTRTVRAYYSSIDGVEIRYLEYLPTDFDPTRAYPLLIYLHGGGGTIYSVPRGIHGAADWYQYIVVSIDGRPLSDPSRFSFCRRADQACVSPFYFDSPITGPDEQDVLDLLADVKSRHLVDERRIYLAGFSMGGWGTWGIGLRNPGIFAAIAPAGAPTDGFHMRQRDFAVALGDDPVISADPVVRTRWYMISPRWLIENAMSTPVHAFHGDLDRAVPNDRYSGRYAHGRHVIDFPGWRDEWGVATT